LSAAVGAFLLIYAVALLALAFQRSPGFASWHMFTTVAQCEFNLTDAVDGLSFNPWTYLPSTYLHLDEGGVRWFLWYLRRYHRLNLVGEITVVTRSARQRLVIRATHVVD